MSKGNIKIYFDCNIDEFMEIKEDDIWFLNKVKVIIDTKRWEEKGNGKNNGWSLELRAMK